MIELALAFYLIFVLPVQHLWRSARPDDKPRRPLKQRYLSSMRDIGLTLLALLFICWWKGYGVADMGLAPPTSGAPLWCLVTAVAAMIALAGSSLSIRKMAPAKRAAELARARESGMPTTPGELRLFLLLTLFIGAGWELLYRGFLLLALTPYVGVWPSVLLSGLAYGAAHGYKNPKQFAGSIVSALLFATGYALSGSLWWLMVIHIVLPISMGVNTQLMIKQEEADHALS